MNTPVALTVAGSDCSSGAGIQADLKTMSHFEVHGLTAITAVVSETPGRVEAIEPMPDSLLRSQIELLLAAYPIGAVKTGMLYSASKVRATVEALKPLEGTEVPLVIDPVLVATTGDSLASSDLLAALQSELLPHATLITPNLDELQALTGISIVDRSGFETAARQLASRHSCAVFAKAGHLPEAGYCRDLLVFADGSSEELRSPYLEGIPTHGTGCTLSAAITAHLALGKPLSQAVRAGKAFITDAIKHSHHWPETNQWALNTLL